MLIFKLLMPLFIQLPTTLQMNMNMVRGHLLSNRTHAWIKLLNEEGENISAGHNSGRWDVGISLFSSGPLMLLTTANGGDVTTAISPAVACVVTAATS